MAVRVDDFPPDPVAVTTPNPMRPMGTDELATNIAAAVASKPVEHPRFFVPVLKRSDIGVYALIALCLAVGYATRTFQTTRTIVQTKTHNVSVEEQFGKPQQSLDGTQVNPQLKGWVCDVYRAAVILCHR